MKIDCHVHAFPDAIAERALDRLVNVAKLPAYTNGTVRTAAEC